jgi:hypothetical protein
MNFVIINYYICDKENKDLFADEKAVPKPNMVYYYTDNNHSNNH